MPVWVIWILVFIPVYAFIVFFLLHFMVDYYNRESKAEACVRTERFINSSAFGLVTYLCGIIGCGKTTCGSAICNVLSKIKKEKANDKLTEVQNIFADVDFNPIDELINKAFKKGHYTNSDAIMKVLLKRNPEFAKKIDGKFYDTYLYPVSYSSLLRDYIDAYLAILRNNYVYFNRRKFYCWTTNSWAMNYLPAMIDIKDKFYEKDYKIQRYTTIFEDEKVISGKNSTNFKDVANKDGGGDEFFRLIRHLGKGTIHYISTAQNFNRIVKQERELATGVFFILRRKEMPLLNIQEIFVNIAYDFIQRFQYLYLGFAEIFRSYHLEKYASRIKMMKEAGVEPLEEDVKKYQEASQIIALKSSRIKKTIFNLERKMNKFFADSYISYKGIYYTNSDDVGKKPEECAATCYRTDFTFPLCYAYGSCDTHSFSIVNDYLSMISIKKADFYDPDDHYVPYESKEDFLAYMQDILTKNADR